MCTAHPDASQLHMHNNQRSTIALQINLHCMHSGTRLLPAVSAKLVKCSHFVNSMLLLPLPFHVHNSSRRCCPRQKICANPFITTKLPFCCPDGTECNGLGECVRWCDGIAASRLPLPCSCQNHPPWACHRYVAFADTCMRRMHKTTAHDRLPACYTL